MSAEGQAYVERYSPYKGDTYLIHLRIGMLSNETHHNTLFSGDKYLAGLCRCDTKTVQRARKQMIEDGYLSLLTPATGQKPAVYQVLFPEVGGHFDYLPDEVGGHPVRSRWTSAKTSPIYGIESDSVETPAEPPTIVAPSKPKKVYPPEVYELNNYLCELIDHNGSRVPNGGEVEMDAILRIDKRYPPQVRAVIEWCQSDSFWHTNILSAKSLRKQYDRLRLRMKADGIHIPEPIDHATLEQAKAWDRIDAGWNDIALTFPRPQDSQGHLLDGEGRAYYIDPMQPTKRRYFDDE
jgi:hypothetical protein